jgi:hypothetical protein
MNRRTLLGAAVGCALAPFSKVFGRKEEKWGIVRGDWGSSCVLSEEERVKLESEAVTFQRRSLPVGYSTFCEMDTMIMVRIDLRKLLRTRPSRDQTIFQQIVLLRDIKENA